MSNIVNLRYDDRFGDVIFTLYPKPESFKVSVIKAIDNGDNIPRVSEYFKINDSRFLSEFPELAGISNGFEEIPSNFKVRIDRNANKLNVAGKTTDGNLINFQQNINYADNSGTYQAIDNSNLGDVSFFVTKQNTKRLEPFFKVPITIEGVSQNGSITNVSFGELIPLFTSDRNVLETSLVNENTFGENVEFSRQAMDPNFNLAWINDTAKPIFGGLFPEVEFVNGDYYINYNDVLIKTTIEKDENQSSLQGLDLTITNVGIRVGMDRMSSVFISAEVNNIGDYTTVIQNTIDEFGNFRFFNINNLFLNNESILSNAKATIYYDEERTKTYIQISYSSNSIINIPQESDTLFVTFDTQEGYENTPPLNSMSVKQTNYSIVSHEIIKGGNNYETQQSFGLTIYNGFEEFIVDTVLSDGNWSIPENELINGFFYRIELFTDNEDYSFMGLFERVGNRLKYVQTPNDNISFKEEPAFEFPSAVESLRPSIIRPDRFLLQNITLTNFSNNVDIKAKLDYDEKLIVDNQERSINIISQENSELTSDILQKFIQDPSGCIECPQNQEQTYLINRNVQHIAVVSQSGKASIYTYQIVGEEQ